MTGYAKPMNSTRTNFPNCIEAVDGKYIRIRMPNESDLNFSITRTYLRSWQWRI